MKMGVVTVVHFMHGEVNSLLIWFVGSKLNDFFVVSMHANNPIKDNNLENKVLIGLQEQGSV